MSTDLRVERADRTVTLTIDREERRNALSAAVLETLLETLQRPQPDDRVIVIAGAGDKVFCSGADLGGMTPDETGLEQHEARGLLAKVILAMRACPLPVVARVQGLCLAGGVGLALGCDVVIASSTAQFGLPEVNLGLWPFMVSALLGRAVTAKHAFDLMLTGDRIDAETAYRVGIVSRVLAAETFAAGFTEYVRALADKPPVAVRLGKAAFGPAVESPLPAALDAMAAQLSLLTTTRDAAEGVQAFFEKRRPQWSGR